MLKKAEVDALRAGSWRIDCPRIELSRSTESSPSTLTGSGELFQDKRGRIALKAYFCSDENLSSLVWDYWKIPAGKIIPEDQYWNLEATDLKGRLWTSRRFRVDFNTGQWVFNTGQQGAVARATLFEIVYVEELPRSFRSSINLSVFDRVSIPCNASSKVSKSTAGRKTLISSSRDAWKFRILGIDFILRREENETLYIHCSSSKPLPLRLRERLLEALHLVLGRPLDWTICSQVEGNRVKTTLRSQPNRPARARHQPPLPSHAITWPPQERRVTCRFHRSLIERYLRHTIESPEERHPLWSQLSAVWEGSAGEFIDSQALTLCVVIEATLALEYPDLGRPSKRIREEIKKLRKLLEKYQDPLGIRPRIDSLLSMLKQTGASDRLRALIERKAITEEQAKAWRYLRNASTHAYQSRTDPDRRREALLKCEVLFYHLVFAAIGYKGPYIDFTETGWPLTFYPPSESSSGLQDGKEPADGRLTM